MSPEQYKQLRGLPVADKRILLNDLTKDREALLKSLAQYPLEITYSSKSVNWSFRCMMCRKETFDLLLQTLTVMLIHAEEDEKEKLVHDTNNAKI